jgi:hypothetical protein
MVPANYRRRLGLGDHLSRWELGDGSLVLSEEYLGTAQVVGIKMPVRITCLGEEFLVGRGIVDRFRLIFDRGQRVQIEP